MLDTDDSKTLSFVELGMGIRKLVRVAPPSSALPANLPLLSAP